MQSLFSSSPVCLHTCLASTPPRSFSSFCVWDVVAVDVVDAEDITNLSVSLFHQTGRCCLLSILFLAGWTTSSSKGRKRWRRCKMEEAVARWMRHVLGSFHPLFLSSSSPLWYLLSFTLPPLLLLLRAVAERLPLVSLSPSLSVPPSCWACQIIQLILCSDLRFCAVCSLFLLFFLSGRLFFFCFR